MVDNFYLTAGINDIGYRLDNYLFRKLKGIPKDYIYHIIRNGKIRINERKYNHKFRISYGDIITIPKIRNLTLKKKINIKDTIVNNLYKSFIYEDHKLLVINKPFGIAVHGGTGINYGIIEILRNIRKDISYLELAHRLDKDTSGCLILAKKHNVLCKINKLLAEHKVKKSYLAILLNTWKNKKSVFVNTNLIKTKYLGKKLIMVNKEGKISKTLFEIINNYNNCCLVKIYPKTGRTHQIRVHSAYLGHPILGDKKYGFIPKNKKLLKHNNRLYLHSEFLEFYIDGKHYKFSAQLDKHFLSILSELSKNN